MYMHAYKCVCLRCYMHFRVRLIFFRIFGGHIVQYSLSFVYILVYIEHLGSQKTH